MAERICSIEGCGRKHVAHGFCGMHYKRWSTTGELGPAELINKPARGLVCQVDGCSRQVIAKGFCSTHYWRWSTSGHPGSAATETRKPRGVPCEVANCMRLADGDGLCRMHYERRRRRGILGSPNALRAARGAGSRTRGGYRVITVNGRTVLEHRHVMEQHLGRPLRKGETVHHRDGNRSRNTIDNLELWTRAQPYGQRAADLLAWAEEIVARYGPERHLL
jgi:HNH endonuclease